MYIAEGEKIARDFLEALILSNVNTTEHLNKILCRCQLIISPFPFLTIA
jgi:hypothetical protein